MKFIIDMLKHHRLLFQKSNFVYHFRLHIFLLRYFRSSRLEVFCKKAFIEISQNPLENDYARISFLIKLQEETLAQVFSSELSEISKNTPSYEHLRWLLLEKEQNRTHPACDVVATSHLGLIQVETSRTMLIRYHDVATGTSMRHTYLRRLCDVSLVHE